MSGKGMCEEKRLTVPPSFIYSFLSRPLIRYQQRGMVQPDAREKTQIGNTTHCFQSSSQRAFTPPTVSLSQLHRKRTKGQTANKQFIPASWD